MCFFQKCLIALKKYLYNDSPSRAGIRDRGLESILLTPPPPLAGKLLQFLHIKNTVFVLTKERKIYLKH